MMERIVLVTGGGNGLGRAVAARFLADGDTVFITGRNAGRVADTAAEIGAKPIPADASDPAQVARMAGELGDDLDVLVNMAGGNTDFTATATASAVGIGTQPDGPLAKLERVAAAWRANLDANLLSAVLTTTAVLGKLRAGGSIINVGSIGLSAEVGTRGLTANVISPGYIAETDFFRGRLTEERKDRLIKATHDGRAGRPGDIAETAYFLASDGARHITGQTLHVNGGAHTTR
jgi:3-oxoacyl-[acyl-carrier protein] reductase